MAETSVEKALRVARQLRPDLHKRTEQVARIIAPEWFNDDWISDDKAMAVLKSKQRYMQAVAMKKAQDVLHYLGVNTEVDWYEIIERIRKEGNGK